jgi:uroporphyrinogen-III decarboxylase
MNTDKEKLYQERFKRIKGALNVEPVDRIPSLFMGTAFSPRFMGMTQAEFCTNPDGAVDVTIAAMERLGDVDGINLMPSGCHPINLSNLWLSKVLIPGKDLPENDLWQVHEKEIMTIEDYDFIVQKGWAAFKEKIIAQVVDMEMNKAHWDWVVSSFSGVAPKFRKAGYVVTVCAITTVPFELLCGARSMPKFFLDLYRMPDKIKAAMDVILPSMVEQGIMASKLGGVPAVWVGGWRTASALLAPHIWDKLVFPYYYDIVNKLAENGITSVLHWDQDWTRDLARLKELPPKKFALNPDGMTDIRKAKEILGDRAAIIGDVPSSLFAAGTPEDIRNYVRDLVRDIGSTGLILCPGCDAPINTRPENMEAFVSASREFGTLTG